MSSFLASFTLLLLLQEYLHELTDKKARVCKMKDYCFTWMICTFECTSSCADGSDCA